VSYFSPTLMKIIDRNGARDKFMSWPLQYAAPGKTLDSLPALPIPTIPSLEIQEVPAKVFAITRFEVAATEPVVRGFTAQLLDDLRRDGLIATSAALSSQELIVGQYDALFSLNKRRNEVWVELEQHPWMKTGVIA
jgi:hypothetical protein